MFQLRCIDSPRHCRVHGRRLYAMQTARRTSYTITNRRSRFATPARCVSRFAVLPDGEIITEREHRIESVQFQLACSCGARGFIIQGFPMASPAYPDQEIFAAPSLCNVRPAEKESSSSIRRAMDTMARSIRPLAFPARENPMPSRAGTAAIPLSKWPSHLNTRSKTKRWKTGKSLQSDHRISSHGSAFTVNVSVAGIPLKSQTMSVRDNVPSIDRLMTHLGTQKRAQELAGARRLG